MTTQLDVYNRALAALGARRIASLVEAREPRRVLDDLWADCVQFCLEQGMWNFAMLATNIASSGAGIFNYTYAFTKPTDLVHLFSASISANFDPPLVGDFIDMQGDWYANSTPLYVRYTSNLTPQAGANPALWTMTFTTYVAHVLAAWAAIRITGNGAIAEAMERRAQRYLLGALAIDSVPQLPGLRPFNSEARAKPVEGHQPQPIDMAPFYAAGQIMPAPSPREGQQG